MTDNTQTLKKIIIASILIVVAVTWRIINHSYGLAPNLELVTMVSVLAAVIIGLRAAIVVPLVTMVISDMIIGNSSIFMFTWSSFAVIGLCATLLRKFNDKPKTQIISSVGFAIASSFLFFFVTNLGVWLQGWYPATMAGLVTCFTLAVPFYRTMLIGNMIIVPSAILAWQVVRSYQSARSTSAVVSSKAKN